MNENEVSISFFKSSIKGKISMKTGKGEEYKLYVIEIPDDEENIQNHKRTFTVPEYRLKTDKKRDYVKYTYLQKDRNYRVIRAEYDSDNRVNRCLEDGMMTGQQIANIFEKNRKREKKELEESFKPKEEN